MKKYYFAALVIVALSTINLACVRSPQSPSETPQPIASPDNQFPRQRISLPDRVEPGSEFDAFRSRLRQAVRDRDVEFVKALIPDQGVALGFGAPISREAFDDIDTGVGKTVWSLLEHAIAIGCDVSVPQDYPTVDENTLVYTCPNTTSEFYRQYPPPKDAEGVSYEMSRVIVVGENVNVHEQADSNSAVINTLSNEIVELDRATLENLSEEERMALFEMPEGWTPVILPDDKSGYVSNRYAYFPLGTRAVFGKVDGQWQLLDMPGGD
ncbi:SH3 domain-containing protein [Microcoleus sp. FACHB-1515]|uniref:SH3 domain-containing protein n=1 Tax=Cyanophyceae TaxID=3028117 RepID=UPI0016837633|nr:SH3 domain-containing protein [Microcoleus sp. FACHB-1515]MBD2089736.1 SH3 domain-containing protein [Microcoleus sp. FACHB-1515]